MTNILRDLDEDAAIGRLYLPREALGEAGIAGDDPATVLASPAIDKACAPVAARAERHFAEADTIMANSPRRAVRAPRIMGGAYRIMFDRMMARGWQAPRQRGAAEPLAIPLDIPALRDRVMNRTVHIIGAGLAGLATAVRLCAQGVRAVVYEATNQAGGRCRSYHDPVLGITIDNGNHLLLSGNRAALGYLDTIGASDRLFGPSTASFPFIDLASKERWTLRANDGRIPWWIFDRNRRVPGTRVRDYLSTLRLLRAPPGAAIGDVIDCKGPLYDRLIGPLLLAALNTEPPPSSATLAAAVIRETLAAGGRSYRPLFARDGLSAAFVEPALRYIEANGGAVIFGQRLRGIDVRGEPRDGARFRRRNSAARRRAMPSFWRCRRWWRPRSFRT